MGQKLAIYATVPLVCCMQTTRGCLYNSQLLTALSCDATHIGVVDAESGQTYSLTHEWCRLHTRSAHAVTISSCQGRQFQDSLALWDTRHPRYSKRHLYTSLSRSKAWEALSIED